MVDIDKKWEKIGGKWVEKKPAEEMWESEKGFKNIFFYFLYRILDRFENKDYTEEIRRAKTLGRSMGEEKDKTRTGGNIFVCWIHLSVHQL